MLTRLLPSFNAPTINGGGTAFLVRGISMRGLGGDQVLILVNGKRRPPAMINNNARVGTAAVPVDLDLIPTAAIERIEVLRGAAAQYGSDAIAGVINIILKKDAEGITSDSSLGQYYSGDGTTGHEAANFGFGLGRAASSTFPSTPRCRSPTTVPARCVATSAPSPAASPTRASPSATAGARSTAWAATAPTAAPPWLPLGDDLKFYSFSTLSCDGGKKVLGHRAPSDITATTWLPNAPYPKGGQATREVEETDYQFLGGLMAADWDWDLSTTYGRDKAELYPITTSTFPTTRC